MANAKTTTTTTTTATATSTFSEAQRSEIIDIINDFLTNDRFDVNLPFEDVVDACKTALKDKTVQTELAEVFKK